MSNRDCCSDLRRALHRSAAGERWARPLGGLPLRAFPHATPPCWLAGSGNSRAARGASADKPGALEKLRFLPLKTSCRSRTSVAPWLCWTSSAGRERWMKRHCTGLRTARGTWGTMSVPSKRTMSCLPWQIARFSTCTVLLVSCTWGAWRRLLRLHTKATGASCRFACCFSWRRGKATRPP